jgi:WD40 repeat protein
LSSFPPNQCARSVGLNSKNGHVAIGVNNGEVHIRAGIKSLDTTVAVLTDSAEWVEVTTYSPDGSKLAVGSHDNRVYIYDVENNYALISKVGGGTSFVTSVDWSTDSSYLQLNNGAYEYLFIDVAGGKLLPGSLLTSPLTL